MRTVIAVPALLCALVVSCCAQPAMAKPLVVGTACDTRLGWDGSLPCADLSGYGIRLVVAVMSGRAVYGPRLLHCDQAREKEECFTTRDKALIYLYHTGEPSTHNGKPPADVPEGEY